jgi:zinc protease
MPNRKILAAFFLAFLFCIPASAQVYNPETVTLKNGLQIVVVTNRRAPVVSHMLWFKVGALDDPWGKSGIAHFLEHLMFKGTQKHPEGDYSRIISRLGGEENAMTSNDFTAYYATVGKEHLEKVMELESDRWGNWRITQDQMVTERDVILKERQQRTDNNPVSAFFEEVNAILYVNHPYQRPTIGWREEMETLNKKDAEIYHKKYYAPNNAILVLSGDITLAEAKPLAKKYYGALKSYPTPARPAEEVPVAQAKRVISQTSPLVKQDIWSAHMLVNPARPETIAQADAMTVMVKILGDGRTGRLYRRLVMKDKIATQAYIGYDVQGIGPGRFSVVVSPEPGMSYETVNAAVEDEIAKLAKEKVTTEELNNATQSMETEVAYARDSVTGPAIALGSALTSGLDIPTIEMFPKRIVSVTAQAVQDQAKLLQTKYKTAITAILMAEKKK